MLDRTIDRKLERRPVSLILAQHRG